MLKGTSKGALCDAVPIHYGRALWAQDEQQDGKHDGHGAVAGVAGVGKQRRPTGFPVEIAREPHAKGLELDAVSECRALQCTHT